MLKRRVCDRTICARKEVTERWRERRGLFCGDGGSDREAKFLQAGVHAHTQTTALTLDHQRTDEHVGRIIPHPHQHLTCAEAASSHSSDFQHWKVKKDEAKEEI